MRVRACLVYRCFEWYDPKLITELSKNVGPTQFFCLAWFPNLVFITQLKKFEWEWWKPKTPNWCFKFLRYITQWQDCKFLTSVGPICVDGVTSLLLYPLSFFSHFFLFLSFSGFSLSLFFLPSFLSLVLSFFLSLVQPSSAATIKARASKHQDHDHRCWVLILSHQVTSLSNPEIKLHWRIRPRALLLFFFFFMRWWL